MAQSKNNADILALLQEMKKENDERFRKLENKPRLFSRVGAWIRTYWPGLVAGILFGLLLGGVLESKLRFFESAPVLNESESGLTSWSRSTLKATISPQFQDDFATSLAKAIREVISMIDQGSFQNIERTAAGQTQAWKATDQARTEISLKFQANLSEIQQEKNYSPKWRDQLATETSAFLTRLDDRLSVFSAQDSLETVKRVYGEIARGLS